MLQLREALHIIEKLDKRQVRIPFEVTFCTANRDAWRKRKKLFQQEQECSDAAEKVAIRAQIDALDLGGDLITFDHCILSGPSLREPVTGSNTPKRSYSPSHFRNKTRNFKNLRNNEIRKAHIRLIMMVNKKEVLF